MKIKNLLLALSVVVLLSACAVSALAQDDSMPPGGKTNTNTNSNTHQHKPVVRHPVRKRPTPPLVRVGTDIKARLNETLSSKTSRIGDKFTMTVIDPAKLNEGTLHGHVSSIIKSGKVSGQTTMNLSFDSIELRDGRKAIVHGYVTHVYGHGENKADDEGGVKSGSRTKQAVKRGGGGAVAGAIIGGIAGGGKGAAIGVLVGGAAGAGSLAVKGSKELKIENGTELLIHTTR